MGAPGEGEGARRPAFPGSGARGAPRGAGGPRPGLSLAGPAAGAEEVGCVLRAALGAWGGSAPRPPSRSTWAGAARVGCLWGSRATRRWEPVSGRPRLTRRGRGGVGRDLGGRSLSSQCRRMGRSVRSGCPRLSPHLSSQHMVPRPQEIFPFGGRPPRVGVPRSPRSRRGRFPGPGALQPEDGPPETEAGDHCGVPEGRNKSTTKFV